MDVHAAISKSHCGKHYSQSLRVVCLLLSMYLINYQSVRLTEKKTNKQKLVLYLWVNGLYPYR